MFDPQPATPPPLPLNRDEYVTLHPRGAQILLWLALGVVGTMAVVLRFVLALTKPEADAHSVGISSGIVGGLGAAAGIGLIAGINSLRHALRAKIAPEGMFIETYLGARFIAWNAIAEIRRDKKQTLGDDSSRQVITLLDARGKTLGRVTSDLDRFDELAGRIERLSAEARGAPVLDRDADRERRLKSQRSKARRLGFFASFFTLLGIAAMVWGGYMWIKDRQLDARGVDVEAHIDRHYLYNVTGWVEISFTDASGKRFSRKTTLERDAWDRLEGKESVPVKYLPSDPGWNRVAGEQEENPLFIAACGAGLTVMFGSILLMLALGYSDLKMENGKLRLVRFGQDELP